MISADLNEYPIVGKFIFGENSDAKLLEQQLKMGDTISFSGISGKVEYKSNKFSRWTIGKCEVATF